MDQFELVEALIRSGILTDGPPPERYVTSCPFCGESGPEFWPDHMNFRYRCDICGNSCAPDRAQRTLKWQRDAIRSQYLRYG